MESEQEWQDHFPNAIFFGEVICKGGSAVREETNLFWRLYNPAALRRNQLLHGTAMKAVL